MADNLRRPLPPVAAGRPSQNLGHIFNSALNQNHNLPRSIFASNPLTLNRGLQTARNATVKVAQTVNVNGAKGLLARIQRVANGR